MQYKGDLYAYIFENTKSIRLMDKFEGVGEDTGGPYKRLIVKNSLETKVGEFICRYHLIIERVGYGRDTEGDITFSEFKKDKNNRVYQYCRDQLRKAFSENPKVLAEKEIYFKRPYYLRAQNSWNRTGYGWEWNGPDSYVEGTFYGETDDYGFVGVLLENVTRKKELIKKADTVQEKTQISTIMFRGKKYYRIIESEEEAVLIEYTREMTSEKAIQLYLTQKKGKAEQ